MRIFVTGASGYIGGTVAAVLKAAGHQIVGLVRTAERAAQVKERGIDPVIGTLADLPLLGRLAREADAVVNAANADDRAAVEAMLAELRGTSRPFIHTSGSGMIADCAGGEATDKIYDETTPVHPLPLRVGRVALNNDILAAAGHGVRTAVIAPPMIYGRGTGVNPNSIQVPRLIAATTKYRVGKHVGRGANAWSNVHVLDLADLYARALERAPAGAFYYAEGGENSLKDVAAATSRLLGFGGRTESMSMDEAIAEFGEIAAQYSFGSNSRVRARRARAELGWSPTRPPLIEDIERGSYAGQRG